MWQPIFITTCLSLTTLWQQIAFSLSFSPSISTVTSTLIELTLLWLYTQTFIDFILSSSFKIEDIEKYRQEMISMTWSFNKNRQIDFPISQIWLSNWFIKTLPPKSTWRLLSEKQTDILPKMRNNLSRIFFSFFSFTVISLKIESYHLTKKWWTLIFTLNHC